MKLIISRQWLFQNKEFKNPEKNPVCSKGTVTYNSSLHVNTDIFALKKLTAYQISLLSLCNTQENTFYPSGNGLSLLFQFSSVAQLCPTLCDPMNCSTPGLPVHHQLPEFTQTHIHWVSDAIQPSHPLSSPSPPAPNPFQHQSLF